MVTLAVPSLLNWAVIFVGAFWISHLPRMRFWGLGAHADSSMRQAAATMHNFAFLSVFKIDFPPLPQENIFSRKGRVVFRK
jgi:hypothetical protein